MADERNIESMSAEELRVAATQPQTPYDHALIEALLAAQPSDASVGASSNKAEIVAAAEAQGVDSSGTKAEILARIAELQSELLDENAQLAETEAQ